jgi:AcrR family transcriptional regulator
MRSKQTLKSTTGPAAPEATRDRLVTAALQTLTQRGFAGSTARAIAETGKLNQALVFYHFGSVDRLLLAALDRTSQDRLRRYRTALDGVSRMPELVDTIGRLYKEDVVSGHVMAVQEMVAGSSAIPQLRKEVLARMEPWIAFAREVLARVLTGTVVGKMVPIEDLAFGAVALYFGIETITNLSGDRSRADRLFDAGRRLAPVGDRLLRSTSWMRHFA